MQLYMVYYQQIYVNNHKHISISLCQVAPDLDASSGGSAHNIDIAPGCGSAGLLVMARLAKKDDAGGTSPKSLKRSHSGDIRMALTGGK